MLKTFKENPKTGTVGCRLHFSNNTVQHDGISVLMKTSSKSFLVDHLMRETYYKYSIGNTEVCGNTAALMMVRKSLFLKFEGFNENLRHCYEDALFNLQLVKNGYINYCNCDYVAYHHESQTRNTEDTKKEMAEDFNQTIYPFIKENFEKLKKYIIVTN
jgi:GT2 family glycosyltransferase